MVKFKKITKWKDGGYEEISEEELCENFPCLVNSLTINYAEDVVVKINKNGNLLWICGSYDEGALENLYSKSGKIRNNIEKFLLNLVN